MATAQTLVDRAGIQLYDETGLDWPEAELLGYLNEAIAHLVTSQPTEFATLEQVTHVPGTRQSLPAGGVALLRVRNAVNALGAATRGVTLFDLAAMDAVNPGWHAAKAGAVRQFAYDPRDPKVYWVYPPSNGTDAVIEYVLEPAALALGDTVPVGTRFEGALLDYLLFRAYSKDTEYAGQDGRAALHYQAYLGVTGGAAQ